MNNMFDKVEFEIRRMSDDSVVKLVTGNRAVARLLGYAPNHSAGQVTSQIKYSKNKKWKRGRLYNGEMVYLVALSGELYERYKNS